MGFETIDELQSVVVNEDDEPLPGEEVLIIRCGQLEFKKKESIQKEAIPKKQEQHEQERHKQGRHKRESSIQGVPAGTSESAPKPEENNVQLLDTQKNGNSQSATPDSHRHKMTSRSTSADSNISEIRKRSPKSYSESNGKPKIVLKGRGSMKYREHRDDDYGRLR